MITDIYIYNSKALLQLQKIEDALPDVVATLARISNALQFLEQTDIDSLIAIIKQSIKNLVTEELDFLLHEAEINALGSEAETNIKVAGITPIIDGQPVVTPAPAIAFVAAEAIVADGVSAAAQLVSLLNNISAVTG